jgi:hypothetical protein
MSGINRKSGLPFCYIINFLIMDPSPSTSFVRRSKLFLLFKEPGSFKKLKFDGQSLPTDSTHKFITQGDGWLSREGDGWLRKDISGYVGRWVAK